MLPEIEKLVWEELCFFTFASVCWALVEPKYMLRTRAAIVGGTAAVILLLQAAAIAGGGITRAATLMTLTAYLPVIVCLHIISANSFFSTAAVWSTALSGYAILDLLLKTLTLAAARLGLSAPATAAVSTGLLAAACAGLYIVAFKYLRVPFRTYVARDTIGWFTLCFPTMAVLFLLRYFTSSTTSIPALVLLLMTAVGTIIVLVRLLTSSAELERLRETEREVMRQLELQRRNCEDLSDRLRTGRNYRHDLRHHLVALEGLAREDGAERVLEYVSGLSGVLARTGEGNYCANVAVNAVLSHYLAVAEENGCRAAAEVRLPDELPFDELDVCALIANAIENAASAASAAPEGEREISISAELLDGGKLTVTVRNSCPEKPAFDASGMPASNRPGHGIGLRSARAVAKRNHGLVRCSWDAGVFTFRAVLFAQPRAAGQAAAPEKKRRWAWLRTAAAGAGAAMLFLFLAINALPSLAGELHNLTVIGGIAQLFDASSYGWGGSGFSDGTGEGCEPETEQAELENARDGFIAGMRSLFREYAGQRYNGYVSMDVSEQVLCDDGEYLSVRLTGVLNAGGSGEFSHCYTVDMGTGRIITLSELFKDGADYVGVISAEILRQMEEAVAAGEADYFIPGGIWSEEECFSKIDPEQDFYIKSGGTLVIAFEEYEVAPGSMGSPEFEIPAGVIGDILA